jgi:hypothetical protein
MSFGALLVFALVLAWFVAIRWLAKKRRELESLTTQLGLRFQALVLGVPENRVGKRKPGPPGTRQRSSWLGKLLIALPVMNTWEIEGSLSGVSVRMFPKSVGRKRGNSTGLTAWFRTPLTAKLRVSPEGVWTASRRSPAFRT